MSLVNKFLAITGKGKLEKIKKLAKENNVVPSTLYNYAKAAKLAEEQATAAGTDVLTAQISALVNGYGKNKGQVRAFDQAAIDYAIATDAKQDMLNASDVYRLTLNEGRINGWKIGSLDSLIRIINTKTPPAIRTLARHGLKRYEADYALKILRDYEETWPNFMWVGDHHIFDVFVLYAGKILRPWVTAWLDLRTRSLMGWCISFRPNSQTIAMALAHAIMPKQDARFPQCGLPQSVYIDNGKDYRAKYLGGDEIVIGKVDYPAIIERFAGLGIDPFYIDLEYDDTVKAWVKRRGEKALIVKKVRVGGVYARLGIGQRYATAYHPWAKPIERHFRDVVQSFSRQQPGWCGSGHEERPEKLACEIKRGLLLSLPEFCSRFYEYAIEKNNLSHSGHGMNGHSPTEVFERLCPHPEAVKPEILAFALMKKEQVGIHNWGLELLGHKFELELPISVEGAMVLNRIIGRKATIYHDYDLKTVLVFLDEEYICRARPLRRASFVRQDDQVLQEKIRLANNQKAAAKATLRLIEANAPVRLIPATTVGELEADLAGNDSDEQRGLRTEEGQGSEASTKTEIVATTEEMPAGGNQDIDLGIPLTEDERYRQIIFKMAYGLAISEKDLEFQKEFEASEEYSWGKHLYEGEYEYLKFKAGNGGK